MPAQGETPAEQPEKPAEGEEPAETQEPEAQQPEQPAETQEPEAQQPEQPAESQQPAADPVETPAEEPAQQPAAEAPEAKPVSASSEGASVQATFSVDSFSTFTMTWNLLAELPEEEVPMDGFLCTLTEHTHIEECYDPESGELICTLAEHAHTDECWSVEILEPEVPMGDYLCGIPAHVHTDPCYDPETGELICGLEEHIHDESCLPEGVEYICGLTEHTHDEYVCYDAQGNLTCQRVEHTHTEACLPLEFPMAEQTLTATIYEDGNYAALLEEDDTVITVTGLLPEGVEIRAYPQAVQMDDAVVLCAYDITMFLPDGSVYAPEDDGTFSVSFQMPSYGELVEESAYSYSEYTVYHIPEDGEPEPMDTTVEGDSLIFETDHFSLYVGTVQTTSLLPQAVEEEPEDVTVETKELGGEAGQVTESGGTNVASGKYEEDNVSVSKTIEETGIENVFDITLKVNTQTKIEEIEKVQPLDVVIVLDVSNTMTYKFGTTAPNNAWKTDSRYASAMEAAENFINQFQAESAGIKANRRIGVVAFNTHGHVISELTECKNDAQASALIRTIKDKTEDILGASGYNTSHDRFTNMEAGLYWANHMLSEDSNAGENKYVIFLSDGFPTTFGLGENSSGTGGKDPYDLNGNTFANRLYSPPVPCKWGTSYSDQAAHYAENWAGVLKGSYSEPGRTSAKAKVFVVGVDIGGQTVGQYEDDGIKDGFSVIDAYPQGHPDKHGRKYVIGNGSDAQEFKNWLTDYISSGPGYYLDSNNNQQLTDAFAKIFQTIKEQTEKAVEASWVANDPIKSGASGEDYIEFIGFYDKDKNLVPVGINGASLTGSAGQDKENTASWTEDSDAISWDLKNSGYIANASGNTTTYTYTLKYRVRLENEKGGFVDSKTYQTNGETTMIYRVETNGVLSNAKRIEFPEPAVMGYLETLKFTKVDDANNKLAGAEFTLTHAKSCSLCHGDKTAVPLKVYQATSGADGTVTFAKIPSGHDYILEETQAPLGYSKIDDTWTVKVHYNNDEPNAADARTDAVLTLYYEEGSAVDNINAFQVTNVSQPELPSTGGMGTTPFVTLGSLFTIGAGLLLLAQRRGKGGRAV